MLTSSSSWCAESTGAAGAMIAPAEVHNAWVGVGPEAVGLEAAATSFRALGSQTAAGGSSNGGGGEGARAIGPSVVVGGMACGVAGELSLEESLDSRSRARRDL